MIAQRNVLALAALRVSDIPGRKILRERAGIRPRELNLALCGNVPHDYTACQPIVFGFRVAQMGRNQHVVVNRERRDAICNGGVEEG